MENVSVLAPCLIRNFKLVDAGQSREAQLKELLLKGPWPTRSVRDNLADVSAT